MCITTCFITRMKHLMPLKFFKVEVEKRCEKNIKMVRTNRGEEYYGRYTKSRQAMDPFAKYLQINEIVSQYNMRGSSYQSGVAKRRYRTLMDMVRSMHNNSRFSKLLWSEAFKSVVYILKRIPTKDVPKTPFELIKGWKPSLRQIRVW